MGPYEGEPGEELRAAVTAATSAPATEGPTATLNQRVDSRRLLASMRPAEVTRAFRCDWEAAVKATANTALSTATAHRWVKVKAPASAATGTVAKETARIRSQPIMTGRFPRCSTFRPIGRASRAVASADRPASSDTCHSDTCRTMTAMKGRATIPIADPN